MASSVDAQSGMKDAASSAVNETQDKVQDVAGQARERAVEAKEQGMTMLRGQIDQRSSQAAQQIHSNAQDLRSVAQELRNQGKDTPARIAEQIADKGEQVGGYLRTTDSERLLRDAEQFARRQPWAVLAGGLVLGFAASRLLKSSSKRRSTENTCYRSSSQLRSRLESQGAPVPPSGQVSGYSESPVSEGL